MRKFDIKHSDEGLKLQTSTLLSLYGGNLTLINLFENQIFKPRFSSQSEPRQNKLQLENRHLWRSMWEMT